ncbi:hypothetical protein [Pseudomonas viridiflava]|uniref:hypothetical protein n=1 Tax=Pseudomonas viridiflava TaxID=33069 RepID=UPI0039B8E400
MQVQLQGSICRFQESPSPRFMRPARSSRLQLTLRTGNEFEGKAFELIHEADTFRKLSKLLEEQEAVKATKKKYLYVEVVSFKSM